VNAAARTAELRARINVLALASVVRSTPAERDARNAEIRKAEARNDRAAPGAGERGGGVVIPTALQPAAANDALRPPRAVVFQTLSGAQHAARRLASNASEAGTCQPIDYVSGLGAWRATDGDAVFAVSTDQIGDFAVKSVSLSEVGRRQQAGMRARAEEHLDRAAKWVADANKARKDGAVQKEFFRLAAEERSKARAIELLLTVATVRDALVDDTEPLFSSERDARAEGSR
jgi:hypothetical protein